MERRMEILLRHALLLVLLLSGRALSSEPRVDWKAEVEHFGFSIDSEESLKALLHTGNYPAQFSAVYALYDTKPKAVAVKEIKRFLEVKNLEVRAAAASRLADLGDRSGLEPMRQAFREHVSEEFFKEKGIGVFAWIDLRGGDVGIVLDVAIALAKLGDTEVGPFVELAATHAPLPAYRYRAVEALGHLTATVSKKQLKEERLDPDLVLRRVANRERDSTVRMILAAEMLKPHVKPDLAIRVFDEMKNSRHSSPNERRVLEFRKVRKRAQAIAATRPASATQPASDTPCGVQ